jgi:TonB family protein
MRIQGTVRIAAVIDEDGSVVALKLISGHPLLVQAAMDAVKQWRYLPAERYGRPTRTVISIEIGFSLSDGPSQKPTREQPFIHLAEPGNQFWRQQGDMRNFA